jgi:hypothetical protein
MTESDIIDDYPELESDDIKACLAFAQRNTERKNNCSRIHLINPPPPFESPPHLARHTSHSPNFQFYVIQVIFEFDTPNPPSDCKH